jgi:hypothetical protein
MNTLRLWVARLRRRKLYVVALAVLLLTASVLLVIPRYQRSSLFSDLLVNIGATLLGVVVTVAILEPLIEHSRTPDEIIHFEFPYDRFLKGIEESKQEVRILGAWPYVMEEPWRDRFLAAVRQALSRRVHVRILILHPDSKAAEQRTQDLGINVDAQKEITGVLNELYRFLLALEEQDQRYFSVRIYSSLPPARIYRWDWRTISSFFPSGNLFGSDIRHYETNVASGLGAFVNEQFDLLWVDENTQTLMDYMTATIDVVDRSGARRAFRVKYICHEDGLYVVDRGLVEYLFSRQNHKPVISMQSRVQDLGCEGGSFQAIPLQGENPSLLSHIGNHFRQKYGPDSPIKRGQELRVLLRPEPVDPTSDFT